jgi:hypothetical protein
VKSILLASSSLFLSLSPAAKAQGVGASGGIKGAVMVSGSIIPDATVEAADIAKGTQYNTTTDSSGQFQFPGAFRKFIASRRFSEEPPNNLKNNLAFLERRKTF